LRGETILSFLTEKLGMERIDSMASQTKAFLQLFAFFQPMSKMMESKFTRKVYCSFFW